MANEFKRRVVKVVKTDEEKSSARGRRFSWSVTEVRTVTAECGHTRVIRGLRHAPKHFNPCKDCQAGKPTVPVEGPLGVIDDGNKGEIKNKPAKAIIENAVRT